MEYIFVFSRILLKNSFLQQITNFGTKIPIFGRRKILDLFFLKKIKRFWLKFYLSLPFPPPTAPNKIFSGGGGALATSAPIGAASVCSYGFDFRIQIFRLSISNIRFFLSAQLWSWLPVNRTGPIEWPDHVWVDVRPRWSPPSGPPANRWNLKVLDLNPINLLFRIWIVGKSVLNLGEKLKINRGGGNGGRVETRKNERNEWKN